MKMKKIELKPTDKKNQYTLFIDDKTDDLIYEYNPKTKEYYSGYCHPCIAEALFNCPVKALPNRTIISSSLKKQYISNFICDIEFRRTDKTLTIQYNMAATILFAKNLEYLSPYMFVKRIFKILKKQKYEIDPKPESIFSEFDEPFVGSVDIKFDDKGALKDKFEEGLEIIKAAMVQAHEELVKEMQKNKIEVSLLFNTYPESKNLAELRKDRFHWA
jgi:hypothetical protein